MWVSVNILAHVWPMRDLKGENSVSAYQVPIKRLAFDPWMRSVQYRRVMGCIACRTPNWVVTCRVFLAVSIPIRHFLERCSGVIQECLDEDIVKEHLLVAGVILLTLMVATSWVRSLGV